jgi:hypothetical protein
MSMRRNFDRCDGATCAVWFGSRGDEGLRAGLDDGEERDSGEDDVCENPEVGGEDRERGASYACGDVLEEHPGRERRNDLDNVCFSVNDRLYKFRRREERPCMTSTSLVDFAMRPPAPRRPCSLSSN